MRPFRSACRPRVAMLSEANAEARCWKRTASANVWFPTQAPVSAVSEGGCRRPDPGAVDRVELEDPRGLRGVPHAGRVVSGAEVDRPGAGAARRESRKAPGLAQARHVRVRARLLPDDLDGSVGKVSGARERAVVPVRGGHGAGRGVSGEWMRDVDRGEEVASVREGHEPDGPPAAAREEDVPEAQGAGDTVDVLEADRLAGVLPFGPHEVRVEALLGIEHLGRHDRKVLLAGFEIERVEHPVVRPDPDHDPALPLPVRSVSSSFKRGVALIERSLPEEVGGGDDRRDGVDERPEDLRSLRSRLGSVVSADEVDDLGGQRRLDGQEPGCRRRVPRFVLDLDEVQARRIPRVDAARGRVAGRQLDGRVPDPVARLVVPVRRSTSWSRTCRGAPPSPGTRSRRG